MLLGESCKLVDFMGLVGLMVVVNFFICCILDVITKYNKNKPQDIALVVFNVSSDL